MGGPRLEVLFRLWGWGLVLCCQGWTAILGLRHCAAEERRGWRISPHVNHFPREVSNNDAGPGCGLAAEQRAPLGPAAGASAGLEDSSSPTI